MIGQGSPITKRWFAVQTLAATLAVACAAFGGAAEVDVRLRFAWGSGAQAPQTWNGHIAAPGAKIANLQPLGVEADEAAALRLVDDQVVIAPLTPRIFDGCDVTLRGDEQTPVTIRLHSAAAADAKDVQVSLGELAAGEFRRPLDELGGYLLVNRAPGDALRVDFARSHLVFSPGEPLTCAVSPALGTTDVPAPLTLDARLERVDGGAVLWESKYPYDPASSAPIAIELAAPADEGAYRLKLALRPPGGFTSKLTPWQATAPVAARDVEFVVVDPAARLPRIADAWDAVQTIDPTSSKWWQRVPDWTQLDRLPVLSAPRPISNVKPAVRRTEVGAFIELPTPGADGEPAWQAYSLSVREVGQPHAVTIDLPAGTPQQLAVSVIEPDAAGRVQSFGREAGAYIDGGLTPSAEGNDGVVHHRVVFWPRTASPVLLVANQSSDRPALVGTIRLSRRRVEAAVGPAANAGQAEPKSPRLVAAYVSLPRLAEALGAAEALDAATGLSVDSWDTMLKAGQRLAQELRAGGYNAAIIGVAADGASLAPIEALGASPRYDTGPLAASGADPVRKDVLEALLRIFDREGLRLIPAMELATPLARLESLLAAGDPAVSGVGCVGFDGRTWSEHNPAQPAGARYNVLNAQVQESLAEVVDQLMVRYGPHAALGGVAVQLSGRGYGVLPGLAWGFDDDTVRRFAAASKVELPTAGADRFEQRADRLLGPQLARWSAWRRAEVTKFYAQLAKRVSRDRAELQLVLCTDNLFAGQEASLRVRQAVSGRGSLDAAATEMGVDIAALAEAPGVCLLRPRRIASDDPLQARALELQINNSAELDRALEGAKRSGELFFHAPRRLRLASFDAQSPFGADKTHLSLAMASFPSGAAARRAFATALADRDFPTLADGAESYPLVHDENLARLRRLFQELPGPEADVRVERHQPATMRVYRTESATTVCVVNESPWPVEIVLPIQTGESAPWRELGADRAPAPAQRLVGAGAWTVTLAPYSAAARRYETRSLHVGALDPKVGDEPRAALEARIREIEQRMRGLDVERPYPQLQNPDFELVGADGLMLGWQPRIGAAGLVAIDGDGAKSGERALHLRSVDAMGVAAQSHMFLIPATGQLTVRARLRVKDLAADAQVYAWVEYDAGGTPRRQWAPLGEGRLGESWTTCEFSVDDLPLASTGQMRVQFHLAGRGEAWVDGVELFDLRFTDPQRMDLTKRRFAAKMALDSGQLVDCQRAIEGYWPRYLVENVPATAAPADNLQPAEVRVATRPEPPSDGSGSSRGLGDRVRQWVPKSLR